jgi:hypothetical protein
MNSNISRGEKTCADRKTKDIEKWERATRLGCNSFHNGRYVSGYIDAQTPFLSSMGRFREGLSV